MTDALDHIATAPGRRASPRWRLRAGTERTHQSLDDRLGALPIESLEGYAAFLNIVAHPTLALEEALDRGGAGALLPDWERRRRSAAILADLEALGDVPPPAVASVPLHSRAQAWGVLYVLEGARLGGQILLRRVRASRDPAVRRATAYLSHGADQRFWPQFLVALDAASAPEAAMAEGANAAFALFHQSADRVLGKEEWRSRQGSNLQPAD